MYVDINRDIQRLHKLSTLEVPFQVTSLFLLFLVKKNECQGRKISYPRVKCEVGAPPSGSFSLMGKPGINHITMLGTVTF